MTIVIVLGEKITQGSLLANGVNSLSHLIWWFHLKCRSDDAFRNERVKRGKPRKQETQILVGEPNKREIRISYGTGNGR